MTTNNTVLIAINADDYGLTDGVCRAINELLDSGAVTSTTFMAAVPGSFDRARKWGLAYRAPQVGVHLQLSSGSPLSPSSEIPSIVDSRSGNFRPRAEIPNMNPDEVRIEWSRQIEETIILLGRHPNHIDSHHGPHRMEQFADIYLELASKFEISARSGTDELLGKMRKLDIDGPDRVIREWTGRGLDLNSLIGQLQRQLDEGGGRSIELVCHPAFCDAHLEQISSLSTERDNDRVVLLQLLASGWLRANGLNLVAYEDLRLS